MRTLVFWRDSSDVRPNTRSTRLSYGSLMVSPETGIFTNIARTCCTGTPGYVTPCVPFIPFILHSLSICYFTKKIPRIFNLIVSHPPFHSCYAIPLYPRVNLMVFFWWTSCSPPTAPGSAPSSQIFGRPSRSPENIEKYAAGALACWDFEDSIWVWTHDLGQVRCC